MVTGLDYVVFVVAKLEEERGSIIQSVVIRVDHNSKRQHATRVKAVGTTLIGWITNRMALIRGYLIDSDFPEWVDESQKQTIKSRFGLFCAQYKNIKNGSIASHLHSPSPPIDTYKHAEQQIYNKGKGGLDKNTQFVKGLEVKAKLTFEAKYIYRCFFGISLNHFRVQQAIEKVAPYLAAHRDSSLSAARIRSQITESFSDYILRFSIEMLRRISDEQRCAIMDQHRMNFQATIIAQQVQQCRQYIQRRIASKESWPVENKRALVFHKCQHLTKLRLLPAMKHSIKSLSPDRQYCALCLVRKTRYECTVCKVALCTSRGRGISEETEMEDTYCFSRWHRAVDISKESACAKAEVMKMQEERKENRSARTLVGLQQQEGNRSSRLSSEPQARMVRRVARSTRRRPTSN